jgi:hypothetical protein
MELKPEATQSARINKTVVSDGCCNGCDAPAIRCHEPRLCYRIALALVPLQMERVYWGIVRRLPRYLESSLGRPLRSNGAPGRASSTRAVCTSCMSAIGAPRRTSWANETAERRRPRKKRPMAYAKQTIISKQGRS